MRAKLTQHLQGARHRSECFSHSSPLSPRKHKHPVLPLFPSEMETFTRLSAAISGLENMTMNVESPCSLHLGVDRFNRSRKIPREHRRGHRLSERM